MENSKYTGLKRTQRDHTLGFKLSVVEQVESGGMSYKQAQTFYGIQGRSTVFSDLKSMVDPIRSPLITRGLRPIKLLHRLFRALNESFRAIIFNDGNLMGILYHLL